MGRIGTALCLYTSFFIFWQSWTSEARKSLFFTMFQIDWFCKYFNCYADQYSEFWRKQRISQKIKLYSKYSNFKSKFTGNCRHALHLSSIKLIILNFFIFLQIDTSDARKNLLYYVPDWLIWMSVSFLICISGFSQSSLFNNLPPKN